MTTGSNNIHIGNQGTAADTALIRIGTPGTQTATFIAGHPRRDHRGRRRARGRDRQHRTAWHHEFLPSGQDTTFTTWATQSRALHSFVPSASDTRSHPPDGPLEYGLIAEEVAEIYPDLVVLDKDGQPAGVRYHVLPAMLLNELQRQQREIAELRAQVRALIDGRKAAAEQ